MRTRHRDAHIVQDGPSWTTTSAVGHPHREALLLSAFEMLPSTSPEIIDALTLSVPVEDGEEAATLKKLALELTEGRDMHADTTVKDNRLIVRLTRR